MLVPECYYTRHLLSRSIHEPPVSGPFASQPHVSPSLCTAVRFDCLPHLPSPCLVVDLIQSKVLLVANSSIRSLLMIE